MRYADFQFEPDDLVTFAETEIFRNASRRCRLTDDDLSELQHLILAEPTAGAVIKGTGEVRKLRFSPTRSKIGKSGAHRVLYCFFEEYGVVLLITIYAKARQEKTFRPRTRRPSATWSFTNINCSRKGHTMCERKTPAKKSPPKSDSLGKETLAALTEFTVALETGEVTAHLRKRQVKFGAATANHKPAIRKKKHAQPKTNGKKTRD